MKKVISLILALSCILCLCACSSKESEKPENQVLTLSFELNGNFHNYNIEYDTDNNIMKVDNTDYYEFLPDGELITDVTVLDTELTDYFIKNGGKSR